MKEKKGHDNRFHFFFLPNVVIRSLEFMSPHQLNNNFYKSFLNLWFTNIVNAANIAFQKIAISVNDCGN